MAAWNGSKIRVVLTEAEAWWMSGNCFGSTVQSEDAVSVLKDQIVESCPKKTDAYFGPLKIRFDDKWLLN